MKHPKGLFAAIAIAAAATLTPPMAAATDGGIHTRECIYDYPMLTDHECRVFRTKILKAKTADQRADVHDEMNRLRISRANARGVAPDDWRGLSVQPLAKR